MKATELRIGNWVSLEGKHFELELPDISRLQRYENQYQPIPLTEEWLERFGFEKKEPAFVNSINPYWVKKAIVLIYTITPPENTYLFGIGFRFEGKLLNSGNPGNIWIKYVHQLQNLYFALSGEELEIKEP